MSNSPGSATTTHPRPPDERRVRRQLASLMILVAASLGVASTVHLTGHVQGRAELYDPDDAGIAEALIGVVLAAGAAVVLTTPGRARRAGLGATGFAVAGFLVGISITARAGHWPDIAYHLAVLPLLGLAFAAFYRLSRSVRPELSTDPFR